MVISAERQTLLSQTKWVGGHGSVRYRDRGRRRLEATRPPACHAGGRGFESRRSRLLERLQIGRLRCQNRHGDSLGGPIPWAKRLRQNACKIPISCGDLVSGGTNESRSRARHRASSSGVAADRRTRPDHHRRPRASPSGTFSEPTAHTGRLSTWDCQSHVLTSVRGLSG